MAQMLDATKVPVNRPNSPVRWQRAKERADTGGVQVFCVGGDPRVWAVTSASCPGAAYIVEIRPDAAPTCQCKAATKKNDPICVHRAAVLHRLGMLPIVHAMPVNVVPLGVVGAMAAD